MLSSRVHCFNGRSVRGMRGLPSRPRTSSPRLLVVSALKVMVTGAGGRTGALVLEQLLERSSEFDAYALVRSDKAKKKAMSQKGMSAERLRTGSIVGETATKDLESAFQGMDAVILATSCVPKIDYISLVTTMVKKLFRQPNARPSFYFEEGGMPENIDWRGAKNQIDAAKRANVKRFVVVGSMGGTDKDNFLNTLGNGNVLLWKRKAEQYLLASGLNYTIIHPGGLIDKPGGERDLLVDVDDKLLLGQDKRVPRADVARFCVESLLLKEAEKRSFDLASREPEASTSVPKSTGDFGRLLTIMAKNCDYSINKQPEDW